MERNAITDLVNSMLSDENAIVCFKADCSFIEDDEDTLIFTSSTPHTGKMRIHEVVNSLNEQCGHILNEFTRFVISIQTTPDAPFLMEELNVLNKELLGKLQGEDKELRWQLNNRTLVNSMRVVLIMSRTDHSN